MALHDITSTIFFTWGNRSLLADLYALSLHEPTEHGERGICIINLSLVLSVLIEAKMAAFTIFFSNFLTKNGYIILRTDYL